MRIIDQTVIHGYHVLLSRLQEQPDTVEKIHIDESRNTRRLQDISDLASKKGIEIELVPSHILDILAKGKKHHGAVAHIRWTTKKRHNLDYVLDTVESPQFLVLDGITDSRNLGACFRVAEAFGVDAIIVPKKRSASLSLGALKSASGSAERVNFVQVTNLVRTLECLKSRGVNIIGLSHNAEHALSDSNLRGGIALVFGGEETGLRRLTTQLCDHLFRIPMVGKIESLNISVAVGIAFYEVYGQKLLHTGS